MNSRDNGGSKEVHAVKQFMMG